jgi:hypothetical protein
MSSRGVSAGCDRPFVGLRSFGYSDRRYFFGRDDELDLLELQIKQNRCVAVVGRAGCGKSSLISAGLRPRLEVADHPWCWIEVRLSDAPIRELALGLAGLTGETGEHLECWGDRLERVLTKSCFGIGEALALIPGLWVSDDSRVLLFVDQFEELFRFANLGSECGLDIYQIRFHR